MIILWQASAIDLSPSLTTAFGPAFQGLDRAWPAKMAALKLLTDCIHQYITLRLGLNTLGNNRKVQATPQRDDRFYNRGNVGTFVRIPQDQMVRILR